MKKKNNNDMGDKFVEMEVIFGLGNEWNIEFYDIN